MSNVNPHMFGAGVSHELPVRGPGLMRLPLNLIALIVSNLDDVGDLARLCRTCRVLNYMALPQLYKNLTLTSYGQIRYNEDDLPEGYGSASPFSMGLNALVTRNVAPLVRSITLRGEWREDGLEEHARVGRVPDSSMMLNICVRAAIDKMVGLESFSWEISNTKALETVCQGLAQLQNLQSLTLRFPSSRHPRPTTIIPPMPNLRVLKVTDIDPLCYPDDISLLLFGSKKLCDLRMHWSPRMRESQEPSVALSDYFRRCISAKSPLRLKKIAFQNFFALHPGESGPGVTHSSLEEITMLTNSSDNAAMTFVEASWPAPGPREEMSMLKTFRVDRVEKRGIDFLHQLSALENLYFVNPLREPIDYVNNSRPGVSYQPSPSTTHTSGGNQSMGSEYQQNHPTPPGPGIQPSTSRASLREMQVSTIISVHGATLKRLLLPSRMNMPVPLVVKLVHACPNLEQLAIAVDGNSLEVMGIVLPFLKKLEALRILIPTLQDNDLRSTTPTAGDIDDSFHNTNLRCGLAEPLYTNIKMVASNLRNPPIMRPESYGPDSSNLPSWSTQQPQSISSPSENRNPLSKRKYNSQQSSSAAIPPAGGEAYTPIMEPIAKKQQQHPPSAGSNISSGHHNAPENTTNGNGKSTFPALSFLDEQLFAQIPENLRQSLNDCFTQVRGNADQPFVWKRHVKRVGWDVLKHWEIWGLDVQEI
ncbi:hypothetical protein TESG_04870 [Trichophyton tonsurans CBS 112818]|uniref:F-box domain-containing protein n=1 Tax=Trichophyton tonsurans (strain CBS 112818) TaxID=647933 RepID=F2S1L2_TRIT1|nr:hypothetical protein TESG_04870 [Trichophyton tonsurans CBS 112818]